MTAHRRYVFEHPGVLAIRGAHQDVLRVLQEACEDSWWYRDPEVQGEAYNRLTWAFTVSARDQWWAHRRALKLSEQVCYNLAIEVPTPVWTVLPPHTNRGYDRLVQS